MKNKIQSGHTLTFIAAGALLSGAGVLLGSTLFGVNAYDVATGQSGEADIEGVFLLPKAAVVNTAFAPAYWDDSNKVTTTTATDNELIGVYTEAGASGVATPVKLIPKAA